LKRLRLSFDDRWAVKARCVWEGSQASRFEIRSFGSRDSSPGSYIGALEVEDRRVRPRLIEASGIMLGKQIDKAPGIKRWVGAEI
jgi:hypothetical protein